MREASYHSRRFLVFPIPEPTTGSLPASYKHTATGSRAVWEDGSHEAFERLESRCEREPEPLAGTPAMRRAKIDRSIARTGECESRASQIILACYACGQLQIGRAHA